MLSKIEDGLLVICEGEQVTLHFARQVLGPWFGIHLSDIQIKHAALRLTKLKLAKWHYLSAGKLRVSSRLPRSGSAAERITLKATGLGEQHLSNARRSGLTSRSVAGATQLQR
jgi:hypothetical protein